MIYMFSFFTSKLSHVIRTFWTNWWFIRHTNADRQRFAKEQFNTRFVDLNLSEWQPECMVMELYPFCRQYLHAVSTGTGLPVIRTRKEHGRAYFNVKDVIRHGST